MNEENRKPLILELDDIKKDFIKFVTTLQGRGFPCYLIEMAISEPVAQLHSVAQSELETERKKMATNE